eukprot:COSAG02_NODE_62569_length_265_cov_1.006024_1_plen_61_part_10
MQLRTSRWHAWHAQSAIMRRSSKSRSPGPLAEYRNDVEDEDELEILEALSEEREHDLPEKS